MPKQQIFRLVPLLFFIMLLFSSCSSEGGERIYTYIIEKGDFEDIVTVEGYVDPIRSTTVSCPRQIEGTVESIIEEGTYVDVGDLVCVIDNPALQTEYDELLTYLENARTGLEQTRANQKLELALLEAQVQSNEADSQMAQMDSLELQFLTPSQSKIREMELQQASIRRGKLDKQLKTLEIVQQADIKRAEIEIQRLLIRVQSAKERLESLKLKAPVKGLAIKGISYSTGNKLVVGDNVWGNMPIVSIPEMDHMKIKITASESQFKAIDVGDTIRYTFDAMPDNIGWGKITMKTPVGRQFREGSKVKLFELEASLDSVPVMPGPGFSVNCHVILKQAKNSVVIPQIAVFDQDSIKVAYVQKKNGYEMRQVLMGLSSKKETVIIAGLEEKDVIALSIPDKSQIESRILLPDSVINKPK